MSEPDFWKGRKVLVTGGSGFIGSYVVENLIHTRGVPRENVVVPRSTQCDLRRFENCRRAVLSCDIVIHLAAVTGGISFSRAHPGSQYYDSSLIDMHMVEAARLEGIKKFVALGNLFAYAPNAPIPLREENLFDGLPTDAHRGVGSFKRNLALLADLYFREYKFPMVVVYSANAYGPRDSIDFEHCHVIPATIMKCHREPKLVVWGDGSPTRDFLYVEDVAEGLVLAAEKLTPPNYVNIGSGEEISIRELVELIAKYAKFQGRIEYDTSKSGGDARRCTGTDRSRHLMEFTARVNMKEGLRRTVAWYESMLDIKRP